MAKALKCDRCGQFYGLLTEIRKYRIRDLSDMNKVDKYVDLCPDCYITFTKWLTGEEKDSKNEVVDMALDIIDKHMGAEME